MKSILLVSLLIISPLVLANPLLGAVDLSHWQPNN